MDKRLKEYRRELDKAYSYKIAGPSKEDEKLLTKNDKNLIKSLLDSHIKNISFISPRDVVFYKYISSGPKVIDSIRCTIYISSDGNVKGSSVCTFVEKVRIFKNSCGIKAMARPSLDKNGKNCFKVAVFETPLGYSDGEEYYLSSGNDYKESFCFDIHSEKEMDDVMRNFVYNDKIEDPKAKEQTDALDEVETHEFDDSLTPEQAEMRKTISKVYDDVLGK